MDHIQETNEMPLIAEKL